MRVLTIAICIILTLPGCSPNHEADAKLAGGATATMSVRAMLGIHSDWHRKFTIGDGRASVSIDLFEDTGWWRGSNLYLHSSGTYVVHEGQNGCFGFTLEPVSFDVRTSISCVKVPGNALSLSDEGPALNGYPASNYYVDLFYIGRFVEAGRIPELRETRAEAPIVFQTYEQHAEPELPEIL
ncbi:hypothetical protein [Marimonas arenosa]|uniref:Uncharacterized protein n=1 Tax=Marimonas arenosa TaxID=1795305 RepID=A0AAE3WA46_9RHOB|nr:hypothetical protein [Marimonas arenosa]MDQ2088974.1 hypothetical protein [Marimonas arenosa]